MATEPDYKAVARDLITASREGTITEEQYRLTHALTRLAITDVLTDIHADLGRIADAIEEQT